MICSFATRLTHVRRLLAWLQKINCTSLQVASPPWVRPWVRLCCPVFRIALFCALDAPLCACQGHCPGRRPVRRRILARGQTAGKLWLAGGRGVCADIDSVWWVTLCGRSFEFCAEDPGFNAGESLKNHKQTFGTGREFCLGSGRAWCVAHKSQPTKHWWWCEKDSVVQTVHGAVRVCKPDYVWCRYSDSEAEHVGRITWSLKLLRRGGGRRKKIASSSAEDRAASAGW